MTNGEYLQSISMERLAEEVDNLTGGCPEDGMCRPPEEGMTVEGMTEEASCIACWKAWLLKEREEKTRNAGDGVPYGREE